MVAGRGLTNCLKALCCIVAMVPLVKAQQTDLTQSSGLKRFNADSRLGDTSVFDIKQVRVGDNILATALSLQAQGGSIKHISGGTRSRKLNVVFSQPYQSSSLLQTLSLDFDKDKGFVTTVTLNYKIDSIYVDILPVYEKVVEQAIKKYGTPLTLSALRTLAGAPQGPVLLSEVIDKIQADEDRIEQVREFLEDKVVTRKTAFEQDDNGNALLMTGFRQCYFWPQENNAEYVTLCAFRPNSGNMKGQGIEIQLVNFNVLQSIADFNQDDALSDISF